MLPRRVRLVVTDLDNTLYDWVTFFALSFDAMIKRASELLDVNEESLLDEIKLVHQRYHNSEQPFGLLETGAVARRFPDMTRAERKAALDDAFHAFNSVRNRTLQLYPGVESGLEAMHAAGAIIVAHTEASAANAVFRLAKLGLFRWLDRVYAIEDAGEGHPVGTEHAGAEYRERVRLLGHHERKPDTRVLLDICKDYSVTPAETLYIGDSLSRDVGMAKAADACAAWAKYGTVYDPGLWKKLVRVTHWTDADVARAQRAQELYGHVKPDIILEKSFSEVGQHFSFGAP